MSTLNLVFATFIILLLLYVFIRMIISAYFHHRANFVFDMLEKAKELQNGKK